MAARLGSNAPDFTLPNQDRQPVTLSEELKNGPVVLAFFPAAFSGTCTTEMCTFRDSIAELNRASARVLGISVYDVVNPDMIGLKDSAKRAVLVIDRNGTIRHRKFLTMRGTNLTTTQ